MIIVKAYHNIYGIIMAKNMTLATKYGFLWVTLLLFSFSLIGHWVFAWFAYVNEQTTLGGQVLFSDYLVEVLRDTLENWQSEFLQLMWQVAGLSFLFYIGSPQSKEGDDRKEAKLDAIIRILNHKESESVIEDLDRRYPKK